MKYWAFFLIEMLAPLMCFGLAAYMVTLDHQGWAVAFFIGAFLILPSIAWKHVEKQSKQDTEK